MNALTVRVLAIAFLSLSTVGLVCHATQTSDLLSDIERCGKLGDKAPKDLVDSIVERVGKQGTNVSAFLVKRLTEPNASEESLKAYVGILGLCKDTNTIPALTNLYSQTKSEMLKERCFSSLAFIGGDQSVQFLLAAVDKETDRTKRFNLLNCVAQTQHALVLSRSYEVLESDTHEEYWRPIFVFGKMGDKAVPFLVEKVGDTNRNVRFNAIHVLGQWMFAPEALRPLREQFWKEQDVEIQGLILSSVTQIADEGISTEFLKEVLAKAKDKEIVAAAQKGLKSFEGYGDHFRPLKKKRNPSAKTFQREYNWLFASMGHEGSYEALANSSTLADEPALKKLRERILERDSDEAFYDYKRVSEIIWQNRYFAELK